MRKILLAFDGASYSASALEFALALHKANAVFVTGAFLPESYFSSLWSYASNPASFVGGGIPLVEEETQDVIQQNIKRFEYYCIDHGMEYRIHKDYFDLAIPGLKKESRFADLLIICSETFFSNLGNEPNEYLKTLLHDVECPVIIVPEKFTFPASNVLAYDGHASSVHAIKNFCYLLPELTGYPTTFVHANGDADEPFPDELNIGEFANRHFSNFSFLRFGPDRKKFFSAWLVNQKSPILVCGAFGGSGTRLLFHRSFAADVIREHRIPVFISHK